MRARIATGTGVVELGVAPSHERHRRQTELDPGEFGAVLELLCPYFVGGEHTCGIWQDRGAVCRTWHCRHVEGPRGRALWAELDDLLEVMETSLARWCAAQGGVPSPSDPVERWEAYYRECADRVDTIPDADLRPLRDDEIEAAVQKVLSAAEARRQPMPEVLVPHVSDLEDQGDSVRLHGYWPYDSRLLPRTIFLLLAALDGERSWRQAVAQVEAESGMQIAEEEVEDLYRAGIIDLDDSDVEPGGWKMSMRVNGHVHKEGGPMQTLHEVGLRVRGRQLAPESE